MGNVCWSVVWCLVLLLVGWPIAFLASLFYIICMPFGSCINCCNDIVSFFEKGVKLPRYFSAKIATGEAMC